MNTADDRSACAGNDLNKVFGISAFRIWERGKAMRKRIGALILVGAMSVVSACSSGADKDSGPDIKPETTETTVGDAIGQDSEIQITTAEGYSTSDQSESNNETLLRESDESSTNETTGQTTTGQTTAQQSTTKAQQTTTQKSTTKTQTTTKEIVTIKKETTTNAAMAGNNRGTVTLDISPTEAATRRAQQIVADIITSSMSDYQCVKTIHDYLVKNIDYGFVGLKDTTGSDLAHRAEGALCYDTAVCQGYAEAFELLCAQVGIQAYMMYGDAIAEDGIESHAWNVVRIDGEWYQIDCTWDDPFVNGNVVKDGSNIIYKYFLLTDAEMYVDHVLDKSYSTNAKVCKSTLFKGVGERLSLETAMDEPSTIVTQASSFYRTIEKYLFEGTLDFYIAVPETEGIIQNDIINAVENGLEASQMTGLYEVAYTTVGVVSYVVYHITVSR